MSSRSPWLWVPTLYLAEGIPYFVVNNISAVMFNRMGMSNADMALYTSLLYLPWLIKPFWSPFVDILRTKRWWTLAMEVLMAGLFLALPLSLPSRSGGEVSLFTVTLVLFWITAFASATHDIAVDGFYMLGLSGRDQSLMVGIRSTFYRLSNMLVQGGLVLVAGLWEERLGDVPRAWRLTLLVTALLWAVLTLYHLFVLPRPEADAFRRPGSVRGVFREFGRTFATFFRKPLAWAGIAFMLLYRLPEAFLLKLLPPFLLGSPETGGLGLTTVQYALVNNTTGVIGLVIGGILGGVVISRRGLRRSLWPMGLALAVPTVVYLLMALAPSVPPAAVGVGVFLEQFGYGYGFTAYVLYMMYVSEGEFKTSHYALCTAFMAASMMLPGLMAGFLQEWLGYPLYFTLVMCCCLGTFLAIWIARRTAPEGYGCKNQ